jgi:hypothetical protein
VRKLISLVSWIASTCRPTTAAPVPWLHPQPAVRPSPPPSRGQALGVGEKAIELDLQPPFPVSYPTQTRIAGMHHPFEQRSPLFKGGDPSAVSIGHPQCPAQALINSQLGR